MLIHRLSSHRAIAGSTVLDPLDCRLPKQKMSDSEDDPFNDYDDDEMADSDGVEFVDQTSANNEAGGAAGVGKHARSKGGRKRHTVQQHWQQVLQFDGADTSAEAQLMFIKFKQCTA